MKDWKGGGGWERRGKERGGIRGGEVTREEKRGKEKRRKINMEMKMMPATPWS